LNQVGEALGKLPGVHAMTDVTGFGLMGHLVEMAEGSNVSIELAYSALPKIAGFEEYVKQATIPGATSRNWNSYGSKVQINDDVDLEEALNLLPDPQTNGGLLVAVDRSAIPAIEELFAQNDLAAFIKPIGKVAPKKVKTILVQLNIV
jgi:selenide,water dikinase